MGRDIEYLSKLYKIIAIDLSKKIEWKNHDLKEQINFFGRLTRNEGAPMFFIIKKSVETTLDLWQNAATVVDFDYV